MERKPNKLIYVNIPHVGRYQIDTLLNEVIDLREVKWTYKTRSPTPALIDKSDGSSIQFVGQKFDSKYFDLVETGWTHDHCEFCSLPISNIDDCSGTDGFVCNNDWLCKDCYNLFIEPEDIDAVINGLKVID